MPCCGESVYALTVESESQDWTEFVLTHEDGTEISVVERAIKSPDSIVADEIDEFLEEIADCKPASAAEWLTNYLPHVKTIYAFQILSGTEVKDGWQILGVVKNSIFTQVGGIFQADGEGFSDEYGYSILWQFSNSVKGPWWMAVRKNDNWVRFQMDLGDKKQRAAFLSGEIPDGVVMAE